MSTRSDSRLWRSRWAALGAAVAVTLGAGGLYSVRAASDPSLFVPITPTRVLDTRINAGLTGQFSSAQPRLLDVTGTIPVVQPGDVIASAAPVPDGATAIVANVTAVNPATEGFVSVRPGNISGDPTTSNLNTRTNIISPNLVTVEIPTSGTNTGQIQLWYQGLTSSATTHLLVDIVGYYQPGTGTGPAGPPGPPGPRPAQVVWVAKSGGDHTTLAAAMAAITDATADKPYLIKVAPGIYDEPGGVTLKSFVDIEGSGRNQTTIRCACSSNIDAGAGVSTLRIDGSDNEIRSLAVITTGGASFNTTAILVNAKTNQTRLHDLDITASGGAGNAVIALDLRTGTQVSDVDISATGNLSSMAVSIGGSASVTLDGVTANANGGSSGARGVFAVGSATIDDATITATGGSPSYGLETSGAPVVSITESFISGATYSVREASGTVRIANTKLNGNTNGAPTCFNVYTLSFTLYTCI